MARRGRTCVVEGVNERRRRSAYFVPIAAPKKKGEQLVLQDLTADRLKENDLVNRIRERVEQWRLGGYLGVTPTTARLLEYWIDPERGLSAPPSPAFSPCPSAEGKGARGIGVLDQQPRFR